MKQILNMMTHFASSHLDLEAASARPDCHLVRLPLVLSASRGGGGGGGRPVAPIAPSGGRGGQPGGGGGDGGDAVVAAAAAAVLVLLSAQAGAQAPAEAVHPARRAVLKILGNKIKIMLGSVFVSHVRHTLCKQQQKSAPFGGNGTSVAAPKRKSDPSKKSLPRYFPFYTAGMQLKDGWRRKKKRSPLHSLRNVGESVGRRTNSKTRMRCGNKKNFPAR